MACAFTQKVVKLSKMLLSLGHEVFLYGAEGSDAPCTKFIQTHSLKGIRDTWGDGDDSELGYDWRTKGFRHDFNATRTAVTKRYYRACAAEINRVKRGDDFLLLSQGAYQRPVAEAVGLFLTCEPGVGYRGSYTRYKAFESAYLQNFTAGSMHPKECVNGNYYDRVIPNYFDPADFTFRAKPDDYFLYLGRVTQRKGVNTAIKVCNHLGERLVVAGQGRESGIMDGPEFVGFADKEKRAVLLAGARATFVPSIYLEAFGGAAVESMLSGTPIITTDFGVFPEYNVNGITGYRCNTLDQFVTAAQSVGKLKRRGIREYAISRFSIDVVKWQYQEWFTDLHRLFESARDSTKKGWHFITEDRKDW